MAIGAAVYSVIARNEAIDAKVAGGMAAFEKLSPNRSFCSDGLICRVCFMAFDEALKFAGFLQSQGLSGIVDGVAVDVVITSQEKGVLCKCDWLKIGVSDDRAIAWLAGNEPGDLVLSDFELKTGKVLRVSEAELREQWDYIRTENGVDTFRDRETGQELYQARTAPPRRRRWWEFWG